MSDILGLECSGLVARTGPGVSGFAAGQRVCALLTGGGYAELAAAPAGQVIPLPGRVDAIAGAALPEALCTVYSNLVLDAGLSVGQVVLIYGGGSGIGTIAIQMTRALGATPLVTVGSERKRVRCLELGAALAVNYREQDFAKEARDFTGGRGADIVLDCVGGSYFRQNLEALADDGTLLIIGLLGGQHTNTDLGQIMRRRLTVHGSTLRGRTRRNQAEIIDGVRTAIMPLVASGSIEPVIHQVTPIQDAAQAHRAMEAGDHFGKILLMVGQVTGSGMTSSAASSTTRG